MPLSLEIGRYNDVDVEDRICTICNTNAVEDEEHIILVCSNLEELRKKHLKKMEIDKNVPSKNNVERMKFMLKHQNLKNFGIMLEEMLDARRDILYNNVN